MEDVSPYTTIYISPPDEDEEDREEEDEDQEDENGLPLSGDQFQDYFDMNPGEEVPPLPFQSHICSSLMEKLDALKDENAFSEHVYLQLANHLKQKFEDEQKVVNLVVQMSGLLRHVHQTAQALKTNLAVQTDCTNEAAKKAAQLQAQLSRLLKMREKWRKSRFAYNHYRFAKVMAELERVVDRTPPYDWCCAECEILEDGNEDASNVSNASNVSSVASQTTESRTDRVIIKYQRKLYVISEEHQRRLDRMSSPVVVRSEAVPEPDAEQQEQQERAWTRFVESESQPESIPFVSPSFRSSAVRFEHDSA